jgi:hypothetical protein
MSHSALMTDGVQPLFEELWRCELGTEPATLGQCTSPSGEFYNPTLTASATVSRQCSIHIHNFRIRERARPCRMLYYGGSAPREKIHFHGEGNILVPDETREVETRVGR